METNIWDNWMKVDGTRIPDLKEYIGQQIAERTVGKYNKAHDLEIIIGTDSMIKSDNKRAKGKVISFMTVIIFKKGKNGCHVIKRRNEEKATGFVPTALKLNGEINRTAALAFWMRDNITIEPEIHLDVNPKETAGSFEVYKPDGFAASATADYYL